MADGADVHGPSLGPGLRGRKVTNPVELENRPRWRWEGVPALAGMPFPRTDVWGLGHAAQ